MEEEDEEEVVEVVGEDGKVGEGAESGPCRPTRQAVAVYGYNIQGERWLNAMYKSDPYLPRKKDPVRTCTISGWYRGALRQVCSLSHSK